jgi:hypothetical protein
MKLWSELAYIFKRMVEKTLGLQLDRRTDLWSIQPNLFHHK